MRHYDEALKQRILDFVDNYYLEHNVSPGLQQIAEALHQVKSTIRNYLIKMDEEGTLIYLGRAGIKTRTTEKVSFETVSVALVGSIACGEPLLAEQNISEIFNLPKSLLGEGKFFMLTARGNSMINAGINDGDKVIIRQQNTADEGQIIVALLNDEATLKRFYKDNKHKKFRLHPENDEYEDIYVDELEIQGVAVSTMKALI